MKIHIVKSGDTLYELAKKYNVELDKLIAANPHIVNPDQLDIGMKVKIPTAPKPLAPAEGTYKFKHVVKQGDTLWKLGKAWDVPLADLIAANPQLKNPNVLLTGEIVYIPKTAADGHAAPAGTASGTSPMPDAVLGEYELPAPTWAIEAPGPQIGSGVPEWPGAHAGSGVPEWPGMHAGWPIEAPETPAGYTPLPQQAPVGAEAPGEQAGAQPGPWAYEPFMPAMPQAPSLTEPFAGVHDGGQEAVHPFAQAYVPATEAFAQQQPELPAIPEQPFADYMHGYGSYPYMAGSETAAPAHDMPPVPYPYSHLPDCCSGPKLDMPGGYGAYGPGTLPYAAPSMPLFVPGYVYPAYAMPGAPSYGQGAPEGADPSMAYTSGWPGAAEAPFMPMMPYMPMHEPYAAYPDIPKYPEGTGAVALEQKQEEVDISVDEEKAAVRAKTVSSGKRAKQPSQRERIAAFLRSERQRTGARFEHRPNTPWINV
ncbi:LysM peptidoglycan-binding domain-containing protein [Gordoniibacillus kamchatkensis]|uniref:LysM peptidoglycan-binding domain-containing protein n=1 Tax=Gordoniibacillus kamchatkensis TaxID=1590651 RepID=UPI000697FD72|nr:LysM peptidoglycan-binding domain-containing protein [Paenibacillus sp. VKM B-2647]